MLADIIMPIAGTYELQIRDSSTEGYKRYAGSLWQGTIIDIIDDHVRFFMGSRRLIPLAHDPYQT